MCTQTRPLFGYAALAATPAELLQQKLAVHESVISAAAHVIESVKGVDNGISAGLVYSFEELRSAAQLATESTQTS